MPHGDADQITEFFDETVEQARHLAVSASMIWIIGSCMLIAAPGTAWFFLYVLNDQLFWALDRIHMVRMGILLLFMAMGVVIRTILKRHRMVGPIHKIRMILRDAAKGRFPEQPVRFRKGEAFSGLTCDLNRCLEVMRSDKLAREQEGDG